MKAHEKCPVCQRSLNSYTHLCNKCIVTGGQILSYIEYTCNSDILNVLQGGPNNINHLFAQVSSLYGDLFFEKVYFPLKSIEVEVNYVLHLSKLIYLPKVNSNRDTTEVIVKGHLIKLDYPHLERAQKRIKNLAVFV